MTISTFLCSCFNIYILTYPKKIDYEDTERKIFFDPQVVLVTHRTGEGTGYKSPATFSLFSLSTNHWVTYYSVRISMKKILKFIYTIIGNYRLI